MEKKLEKLRKDDNKAAAGGGNWPVFDFCNQFLQTELELREATVDLLSRLALDGVVYAEIRRVTSTLTPILTNITPLRAGLIFKLLSLLV